MSVWRVWKFDESDHGTLIVVICCKVLVLNSPSPQEKLRIYAPVNNYIHVEASTEVIML